VDIPLFTGGITEYSELCTHAMPETDAVPFESRVMGVIAGGQCSPTVEITSGTFFCVKPSEYDTEYDQYLVRLVFDAVVVPEGEAVAFSIWANCIP